MNIASLFMLTTALSQPTTPIHSIPYTFWPSQFSQYLPNCEYDPDPNPNAVFAFFANPDDCDIFYTWQYRVISYIPYADEGCDDPVTYNESRSVLISNSSIDPNRLLGTFICRNNDIPCVVHVERDDFCSESDLSIPSNMDINAGNLLAFVDSQLDCGEIHISEVDWQYSNFHPEIPIVSGKVKFRGIDPGVEDPLLYKLHYEYSASYEYLEPISGYEIDIEISFIFTITCPADKATLP